MSAPVSGGVSTDVNGDVAAAAWLRGQKAYFEALHETALGLINHLDVLDLLTAIVTRAGALLGASHGNIYLVDEVRDELVSKVAVGSLARFQGLRLKRGEGVAGTAWLTGEPVVVDDHGRWPRRSPQIPAATGDAAVGVPLKSGDRVAGVITLTYVHTDRKFGPDAVELLGRFVHLAELALANAQLYEALARAERVEQDRNRVLELIAAGSALRPVLDEVVGMVERQRPGLRGSILVLRGGRLCHGASRNLPPAFVQAIDGLPVGPDVGSCGAACYRRETVITADVLTDARCKPYWDLARTHGVRAWWSVPIFASDRHLLGTFAMYHAEPCEPGAADLRLLQVASRIAAVALEHHELASRLAHQAHHDPQTGLANRVLHADRLQQALARARRQHDHVALLLVDLDRFKRINDGFGHHVGDRVLEELGRRLLACVRGNDTVARWSGDSYALIATDLKTPEDAAHVARKILKTIRESITIDGHAIEMTASIGMGVFPSDGSDPATLLRHVDEALFAAKHSGKNTYQFFSTKIGAAASEAFKLEGELRRALERDELMVYYQPLIDLERVRTVAVEALVRWNHPTGGVLAPGAFVPLAEETGMIVPIGAYVLQEACRQVRAWQQAGYPELRVAVNTSLVQFRRADFIETVLGSLDRTDFPARSLELELTESAVMSDLESSIGKLKRLRERGVTIAVDDFGTGHSSLSYLPRLPVDMLKIDHTFVRAVQGDTGTRRVVKAIVSLAHSLRLLVTAEGVETPDLLRFCRRLKCTRIQGYLFARPLPAGEMSEWLAQPLQHLRRPTKRLRTS